MPQKVLINFSDEQIAKLGACKTAADFQAGVDLAIENANAPKTEQKVVALEDVQKIVAGNIATFTASVGAVENALKVVQADVAKVAPDALIEKAKAAGSESAAKALGAIGASGAGADKGAANDGTNGATDSKALIAAGKFEEAWTADKSIQAEFSNPKAYAGYMKASANGQVRIFGNR